MADTDPLELERRIAAIEARLANLDRAPTLRSRRLAGAYDTLMTDPLYQDAIGSGETTPDADTRVSAALWATQVIARALDQLQATVDDEARH